MSSRINAQLAPLIRPISSLRIDEHNARTHDERNLKAVADSLARFGQQKPVVALRDGRVIAGNGTVQSALRLGWTEIAVVEFDSEDAAVAAGYAIADNRTSDLSRFDRDALLESLAAAESGGLDPELLGFGANDVEALQRVAHFTQFEVAESVSSAPASVSRALQPLADAAGISLPPKPVAAPASFQQVDESLPTEHQCPKCKYRWSGSTAPQA